MRCPKCAFVTFDHLPKCPKCGVSFHLARRLTRRRHTHRPISISEPAASQTPSNKESRSSGRGSVLAVGCARPVTAPVPEDRARVAARRVSAPDVVALDHTEKHQADRAKLAPAPPRAETIDAPIARTEPKDTESEPPETSGTKPQQSELKVSLPERTKLESAEFEPSESSGAKLQQTRSSDVLLAPTRPDRASLARTELESAAHDEDAIPITELPGDVDRRRLKERMRRAGQRRRSRNGDNLAQSVDPALPDWYEPRSEIDEPAPASPSPRLTASKAQRRGLKWHS